MMKALIKTIFTLLNYLITALLMPINVIIDGTPIDSLMSDFIGYISSIFTLLSDNIGFFREILGLSTFAWECIVLYFTIVSVTSFSIWLVKLVIKWYYALKP